MRSPLTQIHHRNANTIRIVNSRVIIAHSSQESSARRVATPHVSNVCKRPRTLAQVRAGLRPRLRGPGGQYWSPRINILSDRSEGDLPVAKAHKKDLFGAVTKKVTAPAEPEKEGAAKSETPLPPGDGREHGGAQFDFQNASKEKIENEARRQSCLKDNTNNSSDEKSESDPRREEVASGLGYPPPPTDKNSRIRAEVAGAEGEWRYEYHPEEYTLGPCPEGRSQHERGCACGNPGRWDWKFFPDCPALQSVAGMPLYLAEDSVVRDLNWITRLAHNRKATSLPEYTDINDVMGDTRYADIDLFDPRNYHKLAGEVEALARVQAQWRWSWRLDFDEVLRANGVEAPRMDLSPSESRAESTPVLPENMVCSTMVLNPPSTRVVNPRDAEATKGVSYQPRVGRITVRLPLAPHQGKSRGDENRG